MIVHEGNLSGAGIRLGIVAARFNETVVRTLVNGAVDVARRAGVADDAIELVWVPGAFEIPVVAATLASSGRVDAVLCLGAVIRGDTPHFDYVAGQAASGVAKVGLDTGVPVIFGVLTTDTAEQAEARAGGKAGNKGADAALAAIETVNVLRSLRG
ncbi:MAG: 6,7-dimethyl-8-ribityllumazine synthase [Actinobacteria bacterium]|uniref:6,7-dimethyl-8-ribityllumazine synthase n=1 Tax=freshwater metagenome TaxID=449393 RepID=A0A6J7P2E1_9ZZZZ|nr:6,7-dimethyl-8-ribityllumazine synthase [Actinomycetota bacterium]MSW90210.1 6,7-dimethyl-8-ribityllumazine synthase [Actinomycetota bacterium]MSX88270.1 6,7-dimethyl-8-ribityllumazine synthase [Actinomycetota bacterium]MSY71335.1 6,7-dimethyl-8-ribityllumazine synthase [Actinomycetota bacterium]